MRIFSKIVPFVFLGVFLVIFVLGLLLFSYLLILGALVGIILFAIAWIKDTFFSTKKKSPSEKRGRIIEHDK
ncbi:MAG TPA: hypothetical protein VJL60_04270 [Gammaproteobacteria bacterium]|nr:hypothetical protein [Gammaproteobacteria bacterium]